MNEGEIKGDGIDIPFDIVKVNEVQIVLLMDGIVYAVAAILEKVESQRSISCYSPLCSDRITVHIDQCGYLIRVGAVKTMTYNRFIGFLVIYITKEIDLICLQRLSTRTVAIITTAVENHRRTSTEEVNDFIHVAPLIYKR